MAAIKKIRVDRTSSSDNDTEDKGSVSLVEKARQLNTSRTINGVSFNGTANISFGTDSVSEGSTNLYFTNARARGAVSAGTGISYNSTTGVISTSAIPNASLSNSSVTVNGSAISLGGSATVTANTTNTLTIGTGLSGTSFNGSSAVTIANTGILSVSGTAPISASTTSGATTVSITAATTLAAGSMSAADKSKLDGIATGATANTGTVTSVVGGSYLTGGTITTSGTLAVDATSANTASKVVARDASGNFSAGTITATLTGTATGLAGTPNITVGTITSGAIAATGAITATGEITAYFSDRNLKKDIVEIQDPIAKVMSIRGVTFRPNETALALGVTDKEEVGVIAQEVEEVLPQLVAPSAFKGYKTVKYDKLTALLLEAVKAQQLQIDSLRAEIAKLGGSATTEL